MVVMGLWSSWVSDPPSSDYQSYLLAYTSKGPFDLWLIVWEVCLQPSTLGMPPWWGASLSPFMKRLLQCTSIEALPVPNAYTTTEQTTGVFCFQNTCTYSDVFLEVGRLKVLELERIYQNRTGCNRLSQCITSRRTTTDQAIHCDNLLQPVRFW